MHTSLPRVLNLILLAAIVVASFIVYPRLPERIPTHFGLSGEADAWSRKSPVSWFFLPGLAVVMAVVQYALVGLIPRYPHLLNIPGKERFLGLSPDQRTPVIRLVTRMLDWVTLSVTFVFAAIQVGQYRTARGENGEPFILGTLFVAPVILILVGLFTQKVEQLISEISGTGAKPRRR